MSSKILTKRQNYRLCYAGAYGNRARQWASLDEWRASGYAEPVALRVALAGGGGPSEFNVLPSQVDHLVNPWGVPRECVQVAEMLDGCRILQGEYLCDVVEVGGSAYHCAFLHTRETGPMPLALKKSSCTAYGLAADLLLREVMTPASHEDWRDLTSRYSGHVLEVSVWDRPVGDLPRRYAIVWEVRCY